jgi:hypothetical protein
MTTLQRNRLRRGSILLACGILLALLFRLVELGGAPTSGGALRGAGPTEPSSPSHASGVFAMAPTHAGAEPAFPPVHRPAVASTPQAPALPFSFLGKITEGGATTILLHASGRTFKVRGAGPLDERYSVDEIKDDHMVIRYLPLETRQVLELESRRYSPNDSAAEYPQD